MTPAPATATGPDEADLRLVQRLRAGDERAFDALVSRLSPGLLRVARTFVPTQAVAEEVVQETWLGVLRGIDRFECRSSLRTWIYRILTNRARTRGVAEHRTVPFATLAAGEVDADDPAVDPDRFLPADHERVPYHWASPPRRWDTSPEAALSHAETLKLVRETIAVLPPAQRAVVTLRDLEGLDSDEVCVILELTPGNQRVLLHRGRSKLRAVLEDHLAP